MPYLSVPAPAKLNLILKISKKRSDGFHNLGSFFHRVSLHDQLKIRLRDKPGLKLSISGIRVSAGKKNILHKAYTILSQYIKRPQGFEIKLQKNIPIGGGLGGGSSDAASFLLAANRLLKLKLNKLQLCKIAERIGSDVPFFVRDTASAFVEGRGEIIKRLRCGHDYFFVIVGFPKGLSTKEMYQKFDKNCRQPVSLTTVRANVRICARYLNCARLILAAELFQNDFQSIAEKSHKPLERVLNHWSRQGIPCLMTGSGSSVFAIFSNKKAAQVMAKNLRKDLSLMVFVVKTYRQSINAKIKEELLQ